MITHLLLSTGGADAPATTGGLDTNLLLNIGLFALLAVVIIFMFRSSRKRRADAEKLQTQMAPGVEVMTQHGIYGTLVSLDEEKNEAIIETTPGTKLRVHRQTLARVVEPNEVVTDEQELETEAGEITPAESPEYGERVEETKPKRAPRKKAGE
jgi:preprotein translocase subunit YajC